MLSAAAQMMRAWSRPTRIRAFRSSEVGTAAVEFGLILPVMLALWAGTAEMAHAVDNWRKVTQLARTVADLTSQGDTQNPISSTLMTDILASSTAVLRPFNGAGVSIVVSAMQVNTATSTLYPSVCSSIANANGTARKVGLAKDLSIPAGFDTNGARFVLAEVTMAYTPMIGTSLVRLVGGINGSINLNVSMPWPTRGGQVYNSTYTEVILPGGSQCS